VKRAALVLVVVCSAFAIGCGSGSSAQTVNPPKGYEKRGQAVPLSPEDSIAKLETPEDRVTYLHQLGKDSTFEPQKHADMLQKYARDSDQDVASAAKELLDRK
jgi:hypothetical protein